MLCYRAALADGKRPGPASQASRLQYSDLPAIQQTAGRVGAEDRLPELARRYAAIHAAHSEPRARRAGERFREEGVPFTQGVEFLRVRVPTNGSQVLSRVGYMRNRRATLGKWYGRWV